MADTLPPELKVPEISRLISRANQIRSHKPAIAYWCMSCLILPLLFRFKMR